MKTTTTTTKTSKTSKFNLSSIMKRAWMLVRTYGLNLAEALKQAWAIAKAIKAMKAGVAHFRFTKADGSIREAFGTLLNVPATSGTRQTPSHLVTYWDNEKNAWRCFKAVNFLGLVA